MASDILNKSLQNSPEYMSLVRASTRNDFLYDVSPSPAPNAFTNVRIQSRQVPAFNTDLEFMIPRSGLLQIAYLKIRLSGVVNQVTSFVAGGGIYLINEKVDLVTKSLVLERNYTNMIMKRINGMSTENRDAYLTASKSGIALLTNNDLSVSDEGQIFIPLFFTAFENPNVFIDTRFWENLVIKFKTCVSIDSILSNVGAVNNPGIVSAELCCSYRNPIQYAYEKLQNENFSLVAPLSLLWSNQEKETPFPISTNGNNNQTIKSTMKLSVKKLVHSTTLILSKSTALGGDFISIKHIKLSAQGTTLFEADGLELQVMLSRSYNRFITRVDTSGTNDNIYTIYYGLSDSLIENSGAVGFSSINDPELEITATYPEYGNYFLNVYHTFFNVINVNGASGIVMRSLDK